MQQFTDIFDNFKTGFSILKNNCEYLINLIKEAFKELPIISDDINLL